MNTMQKSQNFSQRIDHLISRGENLIISVGGSADGRSLPFAYTIGMTSLGLPELLISGHLGVKVQQTLLNDVARRFKNEGVKLGLHRDLLVGGFLMDLVAIDTSVSEVRENYILQACNYYRDQLMPVRLVQLLWPDNQGRLPSMSGYELTGFQDLLPPLPI